MIVFKIILKVLNFLVIIALLAAYTAPYINPEIFWPFAFFGLLHPVLIILNVIFMIIWLLKVKLKFVINILVLIIGLGSIKKNISFGSQASTVREGKLKIISFNSKLFGAYEDEVFFDDFVKNVNEKNPDILCIQEFYNLGLNGSDAIHEIKKSTGLKYHYFRSLKRKKGKSKYGIIVFSRYKIINYGELDFGANTVNLCIFTDIIYNNKQFRIYNVHLQSLKLARTDYEMLKKIGEDSDYALQVSKNIFERLKLAFIQRSKQAQLLKENIKNNNNPSIVCGDFNDTPQSYTYRIISDDMVDCFIESGNGIGGTYTGPLPSLRIDYILHDKSMNSYNYNASENFKSDHKMIETLIEL
ncbi:MAG: endonuclease/exonuclease/phosphatase family protein [Bacteroidia bacterium]|nr:endonuclease/exonuclease/phosphatase family protein [Bacteroidia bacterium]